MEGVGETIEGESPRTTSVQEIGQTPNEDQNAKQADEREERAGDTKNHTPVKDDSIGSNANVDDNTVEVEGKVDASSSLQEKVLDDIEPTEDNSPEDFSTKSSPIGEEDSRGKLPSEGENSPPSTDDSLGRRKRKPSRYHDSMFDIPTNLMNINRTINPEEFRAFHSKSVKQKEKGKKIAVSSETQPKQKPLKADLKGIPEKPSPPVPEEKPSTSTLPEAKAHEDDVLDSNNLFKFKMRKDHVIQNLVGGPTAYKCDICMMTFPRSFSLRRHYTRRHINPRYAVPKSGSVALPDANGADGPPDFDSDETKYLYACKMCSKDLMYFRHKNHLRIHCQEMHNSEPRRPVSVFKCELCKRSYTTRHELERHKRTHSGERPYACAYCHKTFPTSTNARRHERTHTGDRPHICKVCNKGFIQRTDMVKHLRSIHKMKVTKTKAERADIRKPGSEHEMALSKPGTLANKEGDYEVDSSNEFQENIDFAAYLKLDQHDSGTLMGEKALQRGALGPFLGKEKQINNSNNVANGGNASNNLKDLQPSEIMGEDGRPEKCHRCPDCSKMFTSNINLRRHHKLKHERNQLYQHAEPVSMVVEKYKIKDEAAGAIFEPNHAITEENEKVEKIVESPGSPTSMIDDNALKSKILAADESFTAGVTDDSELNKRSQDDDQSVPNKQMDLIALPIPSKKPKTSKISKLSSIVQRLADKRSAEQPPPESESQEGKFDEKQPIAKLEEMGSQLFGQSFSPDSLGMSPKRKKRKPASVQQVKSNDLSEEAKLIASDSKPRLMPEKAYAKSLINKHGDSHRNFPRLSGEDEGIFRKVFRNSERGLPSMHMRPSYGNDFMKKSDRFHGTQSFSYHHNDFRPRGPMMPEHRFSAMNDISKSFHSLSQEVFPMAKMPPSLPEPRHMLDTTRMESFLSQCWSSRKRDIPQNAILDRNMPSRDAYDMTMKLKYNMRHLSDEKINEHLPPSAYFSRRDGMSVPRPPNVPGVFQKDESHRSLPEGDLLFHDDDGLDKNIKSEISPSDGDSTNAPLDLRVASKKVTHDYIVRDDGVLDFSQKTRNSLKRPASESQSFDPKVKIEAGHLRHEAMFPNRSPPMPIPIPNMDKVPPWLRASHQNFWNKQASHIKTPLHPPMPEHRREIVHGHHPQPRPNKKPFKFHSMDFKPPHPSYGGGENRKSFPPHAAPYRGSPFSPRSIRHSGSPSSSQRHSPSMNIPMWPDPNDEKPILYSGNKLLLSQHGHQHFPSAPPCTICNPGPLPVPRIPEPRDVKPKLPYRSNYKNWPFGPRHDFLAKGRTPPSPLQPILPKTGQKDDIFKNRSPFDRDPILDEDMMNRCIIKAQQALKTKLPHDGGKRPMHLHDASSLKPGTPRPTYMQKPPAHTVPRPISPKPVATTLAQVPRVSVGREGMVNSKQTSSALEYEPPSKKVKNSDLLSPDVAGANDKPIPLTKSKELDDKKTESFVEGHAGDVEEGRAEREKLTMTPGLDCTQDDDSEKQINTHSDDVTKLNSSDMMNVEEQVLDDLITESGKKSSPCKPSRLFISDDNSPDKDEQPVRPKSCDTAIRNIDYPSMKANRSPSPSSDASCSKSASPVLFSTFQTSKILQRRHTHASTHRRKKHSSSSSKSETLKRSSSSDSPQCDTDESDGTPRKLIKKLKLRVIKSPGSEKKKYWTLVEQDTPKTAESELGEPFEDEELKDGQHPVIKKEPRKQIGEGISKGNADEKPDSDSLGNNGIMESSHKEEEEHSDQTDEKDAQTATMLPNINKMDSNSKTEPILKKTPNSEKAAVTATAGSPTHNVLTGSHIENALAAIALQPENSAQEMKTVDENTNKPETTHEEGDDHDLSTKYGSLCNTEEAKATTSALLQQMPTRGSSSIIKTSDKKSDASLSQEGPTTPIHEKHDVDGPQVTERESEVTVAKNISSSSRTGVKTGSDSNPSAKPDGSLDKKSDKEATSSLEKPTKQRTTRSNAAAAVSPKTATEKKQVVPGTKKAESVGAASPASSRLRRSVRIRKSSSDKDKETVTTGKKKK